MNEQEIKNLYERYGAMVYNRCLAILKDEDKAFDAMQDVFLKLITKVPMTKIKTIAAYLYTMASTVSLNILKKHGRMAVNSEIIEDFTASEDMVESIIDKLSLENFLGTLDSRDQQIILLKYQQKRTNIEIADLIGISESAIKKRLHKIKRKADSLKEVF